MKALAVLAALTLTLSAAVAAQAAEAQVWAFVYANQQAPNAPYPGQQAASAGVTASVAPITNSQGERTTGRYRVTIGPVGTPGVPVVTAVGGTGAYCQLASFNLSGSTETINVDCYSYNGTSTTRADSKFMLTFFGSTHPASTDPGAYGYVHNNQPTQQQYTPPGYNSTNLGMQIARIGSGNTSTSHWETWRARFTGSQYSNNAGNVQVTAYGTQPARCSVIRWDPTTTGADAQVRCDRALNQSFTPQWTLMYTHERSIVGSRAGFFGYLQADKPSEPMYTPNPDRNRSPEGRAHRVTRSGPGRYQVQVYGPLKEPMGLQLSVNGNTDNYCILTNFNFDPDAEPDEPQAYVDLNCYDRSRNLADSVYSLNYYSP